MKVLAVIDMQNDFISGALGTFAAQTIVPVVRRRIAEARAAGDAVVFTLDTHADDYLSTHEGRLLPVKHCIQGTPGWQISHDPQPFAANVVDKLSFGSISLPRLLAQEGTPESIELCGLCTDICVISNALLAKAFLPNAHIAVDSEASAGVTRESHCNALKAMEMCHIEILGNNR